MNSEPILEKIVSGGQIGVDMIALKVARECGLKTGGYAPKEFKTLIGSKPELLKGYGLTELKNFKGNAYVARSIANVKLADMTIVFVYKSSPGTLKTIGYGINGSWSYPSINVINSKMLLYKNIIIVNPVKCKNTTEISNRIKRHLETYKVEILNVAGHSKITSQIGKKIEEILHKVFE